MAQTTLPLSRARARAKQRYHDWLRSESGLSFGDWLKNGGDPEPDNYCTSCAGTGMGRYEGGSCHWCAGTGDSSQGPRPRRCDDEEPASHEEYLERRRLFLPDWPTFLCFACCILVGCCA